MAGNIPAQLIEEIRRRSDIVQVVSRYLPLQHKGRNYYGLCPFHAEKTPSFAVNPEKQIFHCFGCGAGGDVFGFLMKKEGLPFLDAVKFLAEQCGVILPEKEDDPRALARLRNRNKLFEINRMAAEFFRLQLKNSAEGRKAARYLLERGITSETQEQFELGYAPGGWETLFKYMTGKGVQPIFLQKAGLIVKRPKGEGFYDRFRERVIFPIYDYRRQLIGFGGRTLDEEKNPPKYLNSPETPIYHKGEGFYGLNWSKDAIQRAGAAIVVEGYLDFIALRQAGVENVIASLGTAFTERQAQLISHYAGEVILFFDADQAGVKAAMRTFPLFLGTKLQVRVARLAPGSDPDDFVRRRGAGALREKVAEAVPLVDFVIGEILRETETGTIEGQLAAVNKVLPLLAQLPNSLERASYAGQIAQRLKIDERLLLKELEKALLQRRRSIVIDKNKLVTLCSKADKVAQEQLLRLMLKQECFLAWGLRELQDGDFSTPGHRELFLALQRLQSADTGPLLQQLSAEEARNFVAGAALEPDMEEEQARRIFADCLRSLNRNRLRKQLRELRARVAADREAQSQYVKLQKQLKC